MIWLLCMSVLLGWCSLKNNELEERIKALESYNTHQDWLIQKVNEKFSDVYNRQTVMRQYPKNETYCYDIWFGHYLSWKIDAIEDTDAIFFSSFWYTGDYYEINAEPNKIIECSKID